MPTNIKSHTEIAREEIERNYSLSPSVILVSTEDGTSRLLDMDRNFYAVSASGTQMLHAILTDGRTAAAKRIADTYGIDLSRSIADLDSFVSELQKRQLIRASSGEPTRPARKIFGTVVIGLSLRLIHRWFRSWPGKARAVLLWARVAVHTVGWTQTVNALSQCHRGVPGIEAGAPEEIVRTVTDALAHALATRFLRMNCKERGICCWGLLRSAGVPATLTVGVSLVPLSAHCWCEFENRILGDNPEFCKQYLRVAHYA